MQSFRVLARTSLIALAGTLLLGQPQARAVEVFDADMQPLGMLLDIHASEPSTKDSTALKLFLHKEQRYVQFNVGTGELMPADVTIYYTAKGCRGTEYVDETLFYSIGLLDPDSDDAVTGADTTPFDVKVRSQRGTAALTPIGGCETFAPKALTLVPARHIVLPFKLPVSLPLNFQE